jgi:lipoate-protein ligase A
MIRRLTVCRAPGTDPYENLALEQTLLERVGEEECILYLWQNARTVVIGRNQNPWKECRTTLLTEEGGRLARRLSGGGAVFHDLGNLNFTFLMREEDYDLSRQLRVIETACRSLGVPVERSGRNDLLADGRKFSGNAYYHHLGRAYHHGTLMVDVDMEMVQRYLSPSKAKLAAKGVDSVRSRVVNLRELVPELRIELLEDTLTESLQTVYAVGGGVLDAPNLSVWDSCGSSGTPTPTPPADRLDSVQMLRPDEFDLRELRAKYASDAWLYGPKLPFTISVEDRFPWGGVELQLKVNEGVIQAAKLYTDAMDETLAPRLEAALTGCPFRLSALRSRLESLALPGEQTEHVLSMLKRSL